MMAYTEILDTFLNITVFIFIGLLIKLYTTTPDKLDNQREEQNKLDCN